MLQVENLHPVGAVLGDEPVVVPFDAAVAPTGYETAVVEQLHCSAGAGEIGIAPGRKHIAAAGHFARLAIDTEMHQFRLLRRVAVAVVEQRQRAVIQHGHIVLAVETLLLGQGVSGDAPEDSTRAACAVDLHHRAEVTERA